MADANAILNNSSNHIYFYADVENTTVVELVQTLRQKKAQLKQEQALNESEHVTPIWLHINSPGGDLFAAFAAADTIEALAYPVYAVVEGVAASAATLIAAACTERYITANSFMVLHVPSTFLVGTYHEFEEEVGQQKKFLKHIINYYEKRSSLTKAQLTDKLKKDWWIDAKTALKWGLVDKIYG